MTLHGLVGIHGVQAGRIESGHRLALFRHEFMDGGEHHAAARPVQQLEETLPYRSKPFAIRQSR